MNFVFYLENMVVRFQEHHKPGTRKKEPTIWHKDITIRLLDFGMQAKNSLQKQKQMLKRRWQL